MESIQKWREERHQEVKSTFGDLALERLIDINEQTEVIGLPGNWRPDEVSGTGIIASFHKQDDVCNEVGQVIEGEVTLVTDENYVAIDKHRYAMATAQPGSPHLLAIYNKNNESLTRFSHIENFDYSAKHCYIGTYREALEEDFTFQHTTDLKHGRHESGRVHQSNRIVEVTIEGKKYAMRPFASGTANIVVFRDETSNEDTYSVGRMIVVEELSHNQVKLDFNKAFLPPCAFSPQFNCPMPPLSNRISSKIEAGEKKVVFNDK